MSNSIPDISEVLLYDPKFLDPSQPTGFWFCSDPEDVLAIQINAGCLRTLGDWNTIGQYEPFFLQFCYVLVVCADPEKRAVMVKELRHRLPNVILLAVEDKGFRRCSSVRALRDTYGLKAVDQILLDTDGRANHQTDGAGWHSDGGGQRQAAGPGEIPGHRPHLRVAARPGHATRHPGLYRPPAHRV